MIEAKHIAFLQDTFPEKWKEFVQRCLDFIERHDPENLAFTGDSIENRRFLLNYHLSKKTLAVAFDQNGEIIALALYHRFTPPWTWDQINRWRADDEKGKSVVIPYMIAATREGRRRLVRAMHNRIPDYHACEVHGLRKNKVVDYSRKNINRFFNN